MLTWDPATIRPQAPVTSADLWTERGREAPRSNVPGYLTTGSAGYARLSATVEVAIGLGVDRVSDTCSCDSQCPLATDCTCIEIILASGVSHCFCECQSIVVTPMVVAADSQINLDVRDATLQKVAGFINQFTDQELLIPVSRLYEKVTLTVSRTTLTQAVSELGLVVAPGNGTRP